MPKARISCFGYTDLPMKCTAVKLNKGRRECEVKDCSFYKSKEQIKKEAKKYGKKI